MKKSKAFNTVASRSLNKEKRKIDEAEKALDEDRIDQSMDNALFHGLDEDEADDDSFNDDNLSDSDDEIDDNDSIDIDVISTNKADNPEEVTQSTSMIIFHMMCSHNLSMCI